MIIDDDLAAMLVHFHGRQLNADRLTLLVVKQSTARILDLASRIYGLRDGHVALEKAYFGYGERQIVDA